jgi:hypothetical protein
MSFIVIITCAYQLSGPVTLQTIVEMILMRMMHCVEKKLVLQANIDVTVVNALIKCGCVMANKIVQITQMRQYVQLLLLEFKTHAPRDLHVLLTSRVFHWIGDVMVKWTVLTTLMKRIVVCFHLIVIITTPETTLPIIVANLFLETVPLHT